MRSLSRTVLFLGTLFLLAHAAQSLGQGRDTTSVVCTDSFRKRSLHRYIAPLGLITAGTVALLDKDGDEFFINNLETQEERNENFRSFSNHLDNYLQHAPSVVMFGLSVAGVKGRHSLGEQAVLYVKSELLMLATVYTLKCTVGEARPDTRNKN